MASATLTPAPADRAGRKLDAELGQAARRIRAADVLRGALALAVLTLAYVLATMTLDRSVELPAEARLVGLVGYALAAVAVGYFALYRPLARKLNPRYTARRIEETAEDAKNAVINYVDLQDADMAEAVRARLAARAAQEVGGADTRRLSESRSVVWLLVGAGLLVAALAVCFLVFRPGPFWSLLKRAVHPYTTATIATKTELELLAPELGNASVLSGDTLTVRAHVGGRLPDPGEPDEPRLLVRYSPEAEPEVYPLEPGASPRDLARALPPRVLQNGLFYRVSAGDATTPEYRIDVRPRPTILKSQARYDYPAYTRLRPETADGPAVEGLRGTAVVLTVTANRPLKTAALSFETQGAELPGEIDPADGARATFRFTLGESTSYRVRFTGAEGDPGEPFGPHPVKVTRDDRPALTITAPKETETALPANGLLAVDGIASDDFGLTQVKLRMQLAGPRPTELQSVFYKAGKPLKRPSDGTDPTRLEVQLSQAFEGTKFADGRPANLGENAVVEFWLEALDNCTVPNPNVGRSEVKRVKLGPPETSPPAKQQQAEKREQRNNQEREQEKRQDQQQAGEQRDPNQPRPEATDDRRPKDGQKPPEGQKPNDPANQGANEPKGAEPGNETPPKAGDSPPQPGKPPEPNKGDGQPNGAEPKQPSEAEQPKGQRGEGASQSGDKSPESPQSAEQRQAKREARDIQNKLNQERSKQGGVPEDAPKPREQSATPEEIEKAAQDLNSTDENKKRQAEETLDRAFGKDARERAQQEAEQLKNDLNSPDEAKKQAAQDKLKDLAEQAEKRRQEEQNKPQPKDGAKPDKPNSQQSNDPNASGSGKTPQGQPEGGDPSRKSPPSGGGKGGDTPKPGDAPKAQPGQQQSGGQSTGNSKPPEGNPNGKPEGVAPAGKPQGGQAAGEPSQAAKDLTDPDPAKRGAAERNLDQKVGPEKRKEIQDGLKSDKPAERKAAQDKLDQYAPPGQEGKPSGEKPPAGQQPPPKGGPSREEIEDAASKLNSPDLAERKQAQDTIDKAIGKEAREQAERDAKQLKDDLTGSDEAKRKAARDKLDKLAKDLKEQQAKEDAANAPKPGATSGEPKNGAAKDKAGANGQAAKDAERAARDLASGTPEEKQAARDTLDKTVGEPKRKEIEKQTEDANKAAQSGGANEQADAKRKLDDVAKQAGRDAAAGKSGDTGEGKQPSPEKAKAEQEKAKQLADDLTGDDQAKREAAEKAVDEQIGKGEREKLQQDLKDAKAGDPAAQKRLQDRAEEAAKKGNGKPQKSGKPGEPGPGGSGRPEGERVPVKDDPRDRLRSAELQLADFEKVKADPALQKRLGYTPEQYQRFLDSFRKVVESERAAAKEAEAKTPAATGPKVDISASSKGKKVEAKPGAGSATGSATGKAPPGYSAAQRRFAEEAAKGQQPAPQR